MTSVGWMRALPHGREIAHRLHPLSGTRWVGGRMVAAVRFLCEQYCWSA